MAGPKSIRKWRKREKSNLKNTQEDANQKIRSIACSASTGHLFVICVIRVSPTATLSSPIKGAKTVESFQNVPDAQLITKTKSY